MTTHDVISYSGAHFNPAVTFATLLTQRVTLVRFALYLVAQLCGALAGSGKSREEREERRREEKRREEKRREREEKRREEKRRGKKRREKAVESSDWLSIGLAVLATPHALRANYGMASPVGGANTIEV
jgi:hypothetical protein